MVRVVSRLLMCCRALCRSYPPFLPFYPVSHLLCPPLQMVIGPDGSMAYHPTLQVSGSSDPLESVWHAALVTDRSVFKLGEYLQIKVERLVLMWWHGD